MNREQALSKIKKCLALAKSTNPHEAAAAMRQAQKLQAEHDLTETDIAVAEINQSACSARTNSQPLWENLLASVIARNFGVEMIWKGTWTSSGWRNKKQTHVIFFGLGAAPQIAGYAWDVLSRQLAKARSAHMGLQPKTCKPITRTARGDEFARGWVHGVADKLNAFAEQSAEKKLLLSNYSKAMWPQSTPLKPKDRAKGRNVSHNDSHEGYMQGKWGTKLDKAMPTPEKQGVLA
jgi:Protein of unknown function (DUF2786)